jgi:hypothetical protein
MRQRSIYSPLFVVVLSIAALPFGGCVADDDDPCPGVVEGARYLVEVVGASQSGQPEGCDSEWGFVEGLAFTASANETVPSATCRVAVPELSGIPEWSLELQPTEAQSDGFMKGRYDGTFGDCRVSVVMSLGAGPGRRCFESGSGSSAECELLLNFLRLDGQGCPANCTAWLGVTVTKQ